MNAKKKLESVTMIVSTWLVVISVHVELGTSLLAHRDVKISMSARVATIITVVMNAVMLLAVTSVLVQQDSCWWMNTVVEILMNVY
jgi:ABC-type sugar transport system permease subunit